MTLNDLEILNGHFTLNFHYYEPRFQSAVRLHAHFWLCFQRRIRIDSVNSVDYDSLYVLTLLQYSVSADGDQRHRLRSSVRIRFHSVSIVSSDSRIKRSDLHLSESQRVMETFPVIPVDTVSVRRVVASQVETVQVGVMTSLVPPATFELHSTWSRVHVVLILSAELLSELNSQRIIFNTVSSHTETLLR